MELGVAGERVKIKGEFTGLVLVGSLDGKHGWGRKERKRR